MKSHSPLTPARRLAVFDHDPHTVERTATDAMLERLLTEQASLRRQLQQLNVDYRQLLERQVASPSVTVPVPETAPTMADDARPAVATRPKSARRSKLAEFFD